MKGRLSQRNGQPRDVCDCGERATHGSGFNAICETCHKRQQWLKENQWLFTNRRTEEEKLYQMREDCRRARERKKEMLSPPEPPPVAPPNTLFTIEGFKTYFLVDRYANA